VDKSQNISSSALLRNFFKKICRNLFSINNNEYNNGEYKISILSNYIPPNSNIKENQIEQINEKIDYYNKIKKENIWQEINLKLRKFYLMGKMPGEYFDKKLILKSEIKENYNIILKGFYIQYRNSPIEVHPPRDRKIKSQFPIEVALSIPLKKHIINFNVYI